MKFKIKDKVKIVKVFNEDGSICTEHSEDIGKIFVVESVNKYAKFPYSLEGIDSDWKDQELKLISTYKLPKFLLQYELDEDPVEYFDNLPQVRKRLKELNENSSFKSDSVRLFELKKELDVNIKDVTSITIK